MKQLLTMVSILSLGLAYGWAGPQNQNAEKFSGETLVATTPLPVQRVSPTYVNDTPPTTLEKMEAEQRQLEKETNHRTLERLIETRMKAEYELSKKVENSLNNSLNSELGTPSTVVNQPSAQSTPSSSQNQYTIIANDKDQSANEILEEEFEKEDRIARSQFQYNSGAFGSSLYTPKYYMSGLAGVLDYSSSNVQSKPGVGFTLGGEMTDRIAMEAMFFYSRHLIDENYWTYGFDIYQEIEQYNIGATGKFAFFTHSNIISPYVGGTVNLTIRDYTELGVKRHSRNVYVQDLSASDYSRTLDAGLTAGFDINLPHFSVGLDWKYMLNFYEQSDFDFGQYVNHNTGTPIEEARYQIFSVSAKFRF